MTSNSEQTENWPWSTNMHLVRKLHYALDKQCPYVNPEDCVNEWVAKQCVDLLVENGYLEQQGPIPKKQTKKPAARV